MTYELCKNVMTNDIKRAGFDALAKETFGLSFEKWYQNRYWSDWNQPYTLFDGDKAVSNVTVNQMKVLYQGKIRNYIQIGGVMTTPEYQKHGLLRQLMEEVIKDWKDKCDGIFLLANHSVTEFYPKFGFVEEKQYQYFIENNNNDKKDFELSNPNIRNLDISKQEDYDILLRCYNKNNPFSELQVVENISLLLFYYVLGFDKMIYYLPEDDAIVIAECSSEGIELYNIYYDGGKSLTQIIETFCDGAIPNTTLLFTPKEKENCIVKDYFDKDNHLFVLDSKENIFRNAKLYFPNISYT